MRKTTMYGTLALALLAGAAACDRSDGLDADAAAMGADQALMPQEMDAEVMAQIMEIQQIQQQLEPIQQQALQDPALASQLEGLQAKIETTMRQEGAEVFARIEAFEAEMAAAEAAGDQERMQALMAEAQVLQQDAQALQAAVFQRPDIREPVAEFEAAQREAMIRIDPDAEPLLDRVDELMAGLPM
jgi:hypothetical protein